VAKREQNKTNRNAFEPFEPFEPINSNAKRKKEKVKVKVKEREKKERTMGRPCAEKGKIKDHLRGLDVQKHFRTFPQGNAQFILAGLSNCLRKKVQPNLVHLQAEVNGRQRAVYLFNKANCTAKRSSQYIRVLLKYGFKQFKKLESFELSGELADSIDRIIPDFVQSRADRESFFSSLIVMVGDDANLPQKPPTRRSLRGRPRRRPPPTQTHDVLVESWLHLDENQGPVLPFYEADGWHNNEGTQLFPFLESEEAWPFSSSLGLVQLPFVSERELDLSVN